MRRFEPPFTIEETQHNPWDIVLIVKDGNGVTLCYVYGDDRSTSDMLKLKVDEAPGVARAIVMGLEKVSEERRG